MAADRVYCGTWKILKCMSLSGETEVSGLEGTEFTLDESGDVIWKVPENTEFIPIFNCENFEVTLGNVHYLRFFGNIAGYFIEFQIDQPKDDVIELTYEGWCVLQCQKLSTSEAQNGQPFSFFSALEEGYFSDLVITAENSKEFKVHKIILKLGNSQVDWETSPTPLEGLPEDVAYTLLHYLYCECLPVGLEEETARNCIVVANKSLGFRKFVDLCELFLKNSALKKEIIGLVTDMHNCGNRIIDYFSGKTGTQDGDTPSGPTPNSDGDCDVENLAANPAKLCYVIKQALRESAIAGAKFAMLCDIFARKKNEMSREERHEIIKYCKSRLPHFIDQLHKLLDVIKKSFSHLSLAERMDIAYYLVPEIESTLDSMFQFIMETKTALEQIINTAGDKNSASLEKGKKGNIGEVLNRSLKNALQVRELMKLRSFHEKVTVSFMNLVHKKENFNDMSSGNKIRSIAKNLEQVIEEIPMFLLRIEEFKSAVDKRLTWKEWKYLYKLATAKMAWVLSKLVCHRAILHNIIFCTSELVSREQFTKSLIQLNLLEQPPAANVQGVTSSSSLSKSSPRIPSPVLQFNIVESLCHPPPVSNSQLAKNSVQLLRMGQGTDMKFEIVVSQDLLSDRTKDHLVNHTAPSNRTESHIIQAHCVIIASQCDWFRRALLSGMRESIDKQIVVHDTNPTLFRIFLDYLYGGYLDTCQLSTEQLADLMQLSDRYEVDALKHLTEDALKNQIDEDSALFLLSVADQFTARNLRHATLEFISVNKDIIRSEVFYELPEDLQSEVEEMITWAELRTSQRSEELQCPQYMGPVPDSPSSMSSSLLDIEDLTSAMNISGKEDEMASDSSSLEDLPLTQDSTQLEACVAQLRDIVGEGVPRQELVRIALAADYDVNRALNFFYS